MADNPRIEDLRRRLDREPGSRVFAQLAEELRKVGQLAESVRVARQGLLVHPGYPSARMTLGRALMDMRDLRGARAEFEAVLRGATDNILASRFLGDCLEGLGDLGSALLQYRATLRLAPGDRNLEAQIRALEQKLSPAAGTAAPPGASPVPKRSPQPGDGAIPVLDVDGPMELEGSFEKSSGWGSVGPGGGGAAPAPAQRAPTGPEPAPEVGPAPGKASHDDSPIVPMDDRPPDEALAADGAPFDPGPIDDLTSAAPNLSAPASAAAEPMNQSFPEDWELPEPGVPELPASAVPAGDAPPLSSSTLAELYFNQGFTRQAIDVYRDLLEREPANGRVAARIIELEAIDRELEGGVAAPVSRSPDPKTRRREAVERTITRLEAFLTAVRRA